jgi:hypothetical protein
LGILDIAEKIAELDTIKRDKLREAHKTDTGKAAPERWARVDLIVGVLAHHLEDEDE